MLQQYLPDTAKPINVQGATVPFYRFQEGDITFYQFNTSFTPPPEPFINAMCGLALVKNDHTKLNMINHKEPMGLIDRMAGNFQIDITPLDEELYKITFAYKGEISQQADLTAKSCH
ncbi:MAG: hypothetical protein GY786_18275 [Proteobacteria bacterium]|nr:hypothetical protein [Pseudomonadota bacterium]